MRRRLLPLLAAAAALALAAPALLAQQQSAAPAATAEQAVATFAGGCFWCMEPPYDHLDGVLSTTSGYTGGSTADPTYQEVSRGGTGHAEVVQVVYDPAKVSYEQLLDVYWRNVDPLDGGGQFCDRGDSYRTSIFVHDADQRRLAEASKQALEDSDRFTQPIVTPIVDAPTFYPAEDYHQDYYEKNPVRYKFYRWNCGRDQRLAEVWGEAPTHCSCAPSARRCSPSFKATPTVPPGAADGAAPGCGARSSARDDFVSCKVDIPMIGAVPSSAMEIEACPLPPRSLPPPMIRP